MKESRSGSFASFDQRKIQHGTVTTKSATTAQAAKASVDRVTVLIDQAFEAARKKAS